MCNSMLFHDHISNTRISRVLAFVSAVLLWSCSLRLFISLVSCAFFFVFFCSSVSCRISGFGSNYNGEVTRTLHILCVPKCIGCAIPYMDMIWCNRTIVFKNCIACIKCSEAHFISPIWCLVFNGIPCWTGWAIFSIHLVSLYACAFLLGRIRIAWVVLVHLNHFQNGDSLFFVVVFLFLWLWLDFFC